MLHLKKLKQKKVFTMPLHFVKNCLEYLTGLFSKTTKNTSTETLQQPGASSNSTQPGPVFPTEYENTQRAVEAIIQSYCLNCNITEEELMEDELKLLCTMISIYAAIPMNESAVC